MAQVALPYQLTNGPLADATQVMANFNALTAALNGGIDHTNLASDSQSLGQVTATILQILQAASGIGNLNDVQIAAAQQLLWGTDAAIKRWAAGILGTAQQWRVDGLLTPNGGIAGALGTAGAVSGSPIGWNLLPNSSFRMGPAFWTGVGSNGFSVVNGTAGEGGVLANSTNPGAGSVGVTSMSIAVGPGINVVLSAEMNAAAITAGGIYVYLVFYNSVGGTLSSVAVNATNGQGWTRYSAAATTPANTDHMAVICQLNANTTFTAGAANWRRIKVEQGTIATPYTCEADTQYLLTHGPGGSPVVAIGQNLGIKVQWGSTTLTVGSAGTEVISAITFGTAFAGPPQVMWSLAPSANSATYVSGGPTNISATGFTAHGNTGIAQTLTFYYLAIGN